MFKTSVCVFHLVAVTLLLFCLQVDCYLPKQWRHPLL